MTRKSFHAYQLLMAYVRTVLAPDMAPLAVMSDYEAALMRAVREAFPGAEVTGCWFHYANVSKVDLSTQEMHTFCV